MNRREAVLRELNLYPQWARRSQPAQVAADVVASRLGGGEAEIKESAIAAEATLAAITGRDPK